MLEKLAQINKEFVVSLLKYYKYTQQLDVSIFNNAIASELLIIEYYRQFHNLVIVLHKNYYEIDLCGIIVHTSAEHKDYDFLRKCAIEVSLRILIEANDV